LINKRIKLHNPAPKVKRTKRRLMAAAARITWSFAINGYNSFIQTQGQPLESRSFRTSFSERTPGFRTGMVFSQTRSTCNAALFAIG
jgi:hypothetical protein